MSKNTNRTSIWFLVRLKFLKSIHKTVGVRSPLFHTPNLILFTQQIFGLSSKDFLLGLLFRNKIISFTGNFLFPEFCRAGDMNRKERFIGDVLVFLFFFYARFWRRRDKVHIFSTSYAISFNPGRLSEICILKSRQSFLRLQFWDVFHSCFLNIPVLWLLTHLFFEFLFL